MRAGCAASSSSRRSRCCSCSISTRRICRRRIAPSSSPGCRTSSREPNTRAVPICAKIELEIAQLDPADATAFMADLGLRESGLDRVIRASYDLLGYISFFTVGEDENRAWSIPRGTNAQNAAGRDPHRHPARVHPRRGLPLRAPAGARHARRVPRSRRAPARGQGVHRPRRRRDQLPPRHVMIRGASPLGLPDAVARSRFRARIRSGGSLRCARSRLAAIIP